MNSDKVIVWGNGIEAEFGLFRDPLATFNSKKIKYLFFDSSEHVNPGKPNQKFIYYTYTKKAKKDKEGKIIYPVKLKKAKEFLEELEIEKAGKSCLGKTISGKDSDYVYYLIETKTDDPSSGIALKKSYGKKFMEVFVNELQKNIKTVLRDKTEFRPEYKKKENKSLGLPILYPYGMSSRILLRNLNTNEYNNGPTIENYTGSYHFTFTLPHEFAGECSINSKNHKFFANLIQWIEPLIASAYHSCDDRSVGTNKKYTKGSYRVAMTGWGNFGASDLDRIKCIDMSNKKIDQHLKNYQIKDADTFFEYETLFKYAYKDPKWRNNLPFSGTSDLEPCRKILDGKRNPYALGGDFRTPFFKESYVSNNENNNILISKMYTHGLEIRIFDWFHPKYLNSLGRILVMIAEQSKNNHIPMYVYDDKDWNDAVRLFMIDGWRAILSEEYVKKLEKVFNLKININSYRAYDIFKSLIESLFEKTKEGEWVKMMLQKKYKNSPILPEVNKKSWEFAFVQHLLENEKDYKNLISFVKTLKSGILIKDIKYNKYFSGKKWKNDKINILEFLKSNNIINIEYTKEGDIYLIKKVQNKPLNLPSIFNSLMKG